MWQIEFPVTNLVARHQGTLPVLITCPHGGEADVPGMQPRSGNTTSEDCNFERDRDVGTIEVAAGVAQRVLEIFGEAPYVVIAQYHRKFLDANRSRRCAFEDPDAAPFYDEYPTRYGRSSTRSAPTTVGWGSCSTSTERRESNRTRRRSFRLRPLELR